MEYYNVSNLIKRLNFLATDKHDLTEKEKEIYLECLNFANNELYEIAANGLQTLIKIKDVFLDPVTQSFLLPNNYFKIKQVSLDNLKNKLIFSGKIAGKNEDVNNYSVIGNQLFINLNNTNVPQKENPDDNRVTKYIQICYIENPKILVEIVNNVNSETDLPIYPYPYIQYLLYGALYFFYFSNKIFMEKMAHILVQWENAKKNLGNYLNYSL
jgi:hypothetical protein